LTGITVALLFYGAIPIPETGISYDASPLSGEKTTVSGNARGERAIEKVNAPGNTLEKVLG